MCRNIIPVLLLLLLPGWNSTAAAAPGSSRDCVSLSVNSRELWLEPGKTTSVVVSTTMAKGWWIYGLGRSVQGDAELTPSPTEIRLLPSEVVSLNGKIDGPQPKVKYDELLRAKILYYKGQADFTVPLRISRRARPGAYQVALEVFYMACDNARCFPPIADTIRLTIVVENDSESMQFRQNEPRRGSIENVPPANDRLPAASGRAEQPVSNIPERGSFACAEPLFMEKKYFVSSSSVYKL